MLKIKDNVRLKELEKFGFVKDAFKDYAIYTCCLFLIIKVRKGTREIEIPYGTDDALNILFDLIQANMVEKVSDE